MIEIFTIYSNIAGLIMYETNEVIITRVIISHSVNQ